MQSKAFVNKMKFKKAQEASYLVAELITLQKKSHTLSEKVRNLVDEK